MKKTIIILFIAFSFLSLASAQSTIDDNFPQVIDETELITFKTHEEQLDHESIVPTLQKINEIREKYNTAVVLDVEPFVSIEILKSFSRNKFYDLKLTEIGIPVTNVLIVYVPRDKKVRIVYAQECGLDNRQVRLISDRLKQDLDSIQGVNQYLETSGNKKLNTETNKRINTAFLTAISALEREIDRTIRLGIICDPTLEPLKVGAEESYQDINGYTYFSTEPFTVFFNEEDVEDFSGNAISSTGFDDRLKFNIKGKIRVTHPTSDLIYEGLDNNVFTKYRPKNNLIEIKNGNAITENGKHKLVIQGEKLLLGTGNLASNKDAESFSLRLQSGEKEIFGIIDESNGQLQTVIFEEGRHKDTRVVQLPDYETNLQNTVGKVSDDSLEEAKENLEVNKETRTSAENDLLELAIIESENIEDIGNSNIETPISKLEDYLEKPRELESESLAHLSIGELFISKGKLIEIPNGELMLEELASLKEPLHFRTELINGKETITAWSPDGLAYLTLDTLKIPSSYPNPNYNGQEISNKNERLIKKLIERGGALSVLYKERDHKVNVIGELITESEEYKEQLQNFESAISLLNKAKSNPELVPDAGLLLGHVYQLMGEYKTADREYQNVLDSYYSTPEKDSQAYMGIATASLTNGDNPRVALGFFKRALEVNPNSTIAKNSIKQLEVAFLDTIHSAISLQSDKLLDGAIERIGEEGFFDVSFVRIWGGFVNRISGFPDEFEGISEISTFVLNDLHEQQRGLLVIKKLHRDGVSFDEVIEITKGKNQEKLIEIFELPITSENEDERQDAISTQRNLISLISSALQNPDVETLLHDKRTPFYFDTGGNYVDEEFTVAFNPTWRDKVVGALDIKNFATFLLPVAKVTAGGRFAFLSFRTAIPIGGKMKSAIGITTFRKKGEYAKIALSQNAVSIVGWIGIGASKSPFLGTSIKKIQRLKATIAGTRTLQKASIKFPALTKVGSFVGAEVAESTAGIFIDSIAPSAGLPAELLLGHSQAFDIADQIFTSSKTFTKGGVSQTIKKLKTGRIFLTEDNKIIHALEFDSIKDLSTFKDINPPNLKTVGESSNNIFETEAGAKLIAVVKGKEVASIDGKKIIASSTIEEIQEVASNRLKEISNTPPKKTSAKVQKNPEVVLREVEQAIQTDNQFIQSRALKDLNNIRSIVPTKRVKELSSQLVSKLGSKQLTLEEIAIVESARTGRSQELVERAVFDSFEHTARNTNGLLTELEYERIYLDLAESGRVSAAKEGVISNKKETKKRIAELSLIRARQEGLSDIEIENLEETFDGFYERSREAAENVPKFSEFLKKLDAENPGTTTVHVARGASLLALSHKAADPTADVRLFYFSRATLEAEGFSDQYFVISEMITKARGFSVRKKGFYDEYQRLFTEQLQTNPKFAQMVESTRVRLRDSGILSKNKVRFAEACCIGTLEVFLEGVIKHHNPKIKTSTLVMAGPVESFLHLDIAGGDLIDTTDVINDVGKPFVANKGEFGGLDEFGRPLLKRSEDTPFSIISELVVLDETLKHFAKTDPSFLKGLTDELEADEILGTHAQLKARFSDGREELLHFAEVEGLHVFPINPRGLEGDSKIIFTKKNTREIGYKTYKQWRDLGFVARAYDVDSHLKKGRFTLFNNEPVDGNFIWTIDIHGNFVIGSRTKGFSPEDRLTHSVLAAGEPVLGAGEVAFKNGKVSEVNAWSGHYVSWDVVPEIYNAQSIDVFKKYAEIKGMELDENVIFNTNRPPLTR